MGGRSEYFGPIVREPNEPVFHAPCEGRAFGISAFVLVWILAASMRRTSAAVAPFTFSVPSHPAGRTPVALNSFALWIAMMIGLTLVNYGYPIFQLAILHDAWVPVVPIGSR